MNEGKKNKLIKKGRSGRNQKRGENKIKMTINTYFSDILFFSMAKVCFLRQH